MENMQSQDYNKEESKNETITELAHRHLKDENHTTTDEELKNAKVVLSQNIKADEENLFEVDNTTVVPPLSTDKKDNIDDEENDKNEEKSLPNPYDILGG